MWAICEPVGNKKSLYTLGGNSAIVTREGNVMFDLKNYT